MELLRTLGSLIEPPSQESGEIADLLDLGEPPEVAAQTDLFLFQLYPFASVYLDDRGQLGGEARDRIAGFWRALELAPPPEPDHLTVLLSFYSQLGEAEASANPGDSQRWQHIRTAFFWEHLMSWLPIFLDKIVDLDPPFYRGWAELLARTLSEEAVDRAPLDQLPLHLRAASPILDPRQSDSEDFLEALLSPARSGFILVRTDLLTAGRDLALAVRAGERRYALKALLGQDDKATLEWLAAEAGRRSKTHESWAPVTGTIAAFWSERASATAELLASLADDL